MVLPRAAVPVLALATALVLAVGAVAVALGAGTASAQVDDATGAEVGVRVLGVGTASGTPDVLRFTVGVEVTADSVDEALQSAGAAASRVSAALGERGVEGRDLQTAAVDVQPRYNDKGRTIVGYVVREDLRVTLRDLDTAGETIRAAVAAGGDAARLSGVVFEIEDDEALLRAARDAAFASARDKAEQYADLAGRELGDVVALREDVRSDPRPYAMAASSDARSSVPLEPGSLDVRVEVDARWSLR